MTGTPEPLSGRWPPSARMTPESAPDTLPPHASRQSIPDMMADVVADVSGIVRAEIQLGRAETADNAKSLVGSSLRFAAGLLILALSVTFGTVALVVALAMVIGLLWALLAVAGFCLVLALLLLGVARRGFANASLLPVQTLARVSEDLERVGKRTTDDWLDEETSRKDSGHHA